MKTLWIWMVMAIPLGAHARSKPVELLDAGAAPRRLLAYHFDLADEAFEVRWQMGALDVRNLVVDEPSYSPLVVAVFGATHKQMRRGELVFDLELRFATAQAEGKSDDAAVAELEALLPKLDGTVCRGSVSVSGQAAAECPPAPSPSAQKMLDRLVRVVTTRLTVPLPTVEVGEGAKWRARIPYADALIDRMAITATYRLDAVDDLGFQVTEDTTLAAPEQRLTAPRDGEAVRLQALAGNGTGACRHQFTRLSPHISDHEYTTEAALVPDPVTAERREQLQVREQRSGPRRYLAVTKEHDAIRPHVHSEEP